MEGHIEFPFKEVQREPFNIRTVNTSSKIPQIHTIATKSEEILIISLCKDPFHTAGWEQLTLKTLRRCSHCSASHLA